jgi:hypothetical protein
MKHRIITAQASIRRLRNDGGLLITSPPGNWRFLKMEIGEAMCPKGTAPLDKLMRVDLFFDKNID